MAVLARITIGDLQILDVDADPNGSVTASKGSIASDTTNAKVYQNADGATLWILADPGDLFRSSIFNQLNG